MSRRQAETWEKLMLDALKSAATQYAIEASSEGVAGVLVAGARLRLAAKEWHAAQVKTREARAAEGES
jgi:hypothetical protein